MKTLDLIEPGAGVCLDRHTAPLVLVAAQDREVWQAAGGDWPVAFLTAEATRDGRLLIEREAVDLAPLGLIGLVALSRPGRRTLDAVRAALAERFDLAYAPPVLLAAPPEREAVLAWIATRLAESVAASARRNADLARRLAAVRVAHEDTQAAFRRLESHLAGSPTLRPSEALVIEPQGRAVAAVPTGEADLVQRLPIASDGVCDLAIHLAEVPARASGRLVARLDALESGDCLGEWRIEASALASGWLRLALGRALDLDRVSLALSLRAPSAAGLAVSLGLPHPETRWCAATDGQALDRVLALKVWKGMPGCAAPTAGTAVLDDAAPVRHREIGREALSTARAQGPGEVRWLDDRAALLVRPEGRAPILARRDACVAPGTRHLRATVLTDHPDAPAVEYALAVRPRAGREGAGEGALPRQGVSSPWTRAPAATPSQIHLILPAALTERADLYLGTRLAEADGPAAGVPALFREIETSPFLPGETADAARPEDAA
ncbi:MAG: DUF6212 domain-containing protein [Paracoccaceae bacterium]